MPVRAQDATCAASDGAAIAMARELQAAIAGATLRVLPAARHLTPMTPMTPIEYPGPIALAPLDLLRGGA